MKKLIEFIKKLLGLTKKEEAPVVVNTAAPQLTLEQRLQTMSKADIVAKAQAEGVPGIAMSFTKGKMIEAYVTYVNQRSM